MSKWFSAACKSVGFALVLLAACHARSGDENGGENARPGLGGVITRPDTSVDEVATAEPGKDRHQWDAADSATRMKTGNLTASVEGRGGPLMLAFANGITVQGERDIRVSASESVGPGPTNFATLMGANPHAGVFLYRVTGEELANVAQSGGLCGADKTSYVAVSEYVAADGEWVFHVAAFKGQVMPGPSATGAPIPCGAYHYDAP